MIKPIISILILSVLQACVAYPKQIPDDDNRHCKLSTKKYALAVNSDGLKVTISNGDPLGVTVFGSIVFGTTTLVSGSMVIMGNTLHYMEAQGKCEDSFLNAQVLKHVDNLLEMGGELIEVDMKEPAEGSPKA